VITQKKIDRWQSEFRILQLLIRYQTPLPDGTIMDDGIMWTAENISIELHLSRESAQSALIELWKRQYITRCVDRMRDYTTGRKLDVSTWRVTDEGRQAFAEEVKHPQFITASSESAFRVEALTGMTSGGNISLLTNAALPSHNPPSARDSDGSMVSLCDSYSRVTDIAAHLSMSIVEAVEAMQNGKIRYCAGGHWTLKLNFHRDGKYIKSFCKKCRRQSRNANH
jgi:hypothetical protein